MFKLNMFEGICSSSAGTLSKVRFRIYLIFNFSSYHSDPELKPQSSGFRNTARALNLFSTFCSF
jgi:hypothetical protein